jgi:hypothetical protein
LFVTENCIASSFQRSWQQVAVPVLAIHPAWLISWAARPLGYAVLLLKENKPASWKVPISAESVQCRYYKRGLVSILCLVYLCLSLSIFHSFEFYWFSFCVFWPSPFFLLIWSLFPSEMLSLCHISSNLLHSQTR